MKLVTYYYPSGAVLCCVPHESGSIMAVCRDPEITLQERADKAEREVQEILDRLAARQE